METQWALGFDLSIIGLVGMGAPKLAFFFVIMVGVMLMLGLL